MSDIKVYLAKFSTTIDKILRQYAASLVGEVGKRGPCLL